MTGTSRPDTSNDRFPAPSLVAFLDERTENHDREIRFIVGCCLFGRDRWLARHHDEAAVGGVRSKRQLQAIDDLLRTVGGAAVLVYADVPLDLVPSGETDQADDIPRMSRRDNVLSQTVLSAVFAGIAWLQKSGIPIGLLDIYYDRKDLTRAHRDQFEQVLRVTLPEIARNVAAEYPSVFPGDPTALRLGTIQAVAKGTVGQYPDALLHGTALAHHLCAQTAALIARGTVGGVLVRNHTEAVRDMIGRFIDEPSRERAT